MNKIILGAAIIFSIIVTGSRASLAQDTNTFGKEFTPENIVPFIKIPEQMVGKDAVELQATGIIKEVCQAKGCWMKADLGNGQEMMIRFKDYAFFVPKDVVGKPVILHGKAYTETLSATQLQHYAEDAGKSKEEVASITKPQTSLHFEADGVIIQKK